MSFVEVLRNTEVFKRLTEDRLRRVAALCTRSTYEKLEPWWLDKAMKCGSCTSWKRGWRSSRSR